MKQRTNHGTSANVELEMNEVMSVMQCRMGGQKRQEHNVV
jgi:hypothetical protein